MVREYSSSHMIAQVLRLGEDKSEFRKGYRASLKKILGISEQSDVDKGRLVEGIKEYLDSKE